MPKSLARGLDDIGGGSEWQADGAENKAEAALHTVTGRRLSM